jgi:2-succinyl-6-hydroxy-2,4-cyclohexadiene-1-carboxylate synthase
MGIIRGMHAPAILFLPGFMQRADAWMEVAGAVAERYPSLVLDFESSTFEGRIAEIEAAPARSVLVGYSLGGRLALHAALASPERYGAVVLLGASAGISDDTQRRARAQADEELAAWIETHTIDEVVEHWESNPVFATQPDALVADQREGRLRHDPAALAELLRSAGQGALEPAWDRVAGLDLPMLALAGSLDRPYVAAAERIAEIAPRAQAAFIEGAGHAAHLEDPDATAHALLEFVDEHFGDRLFGDVDSQPGTGGNGQTPPLGGRERRGE